MRVVLERDGKKSEVEVAADLSSVAFGGRTYPVVVVASSANRVELEVDGEKAVIENWPEHFPQPFGPVDVNGERWSIHVESGPGDLPPRTNAAVLPASPAISPAVGFPPTVGVASGDGVPVVPPMPGRVI
ncbi:MAG: hypothetical protein WB788_04830 [Thermoplasmata archaeon]